ncbi:MAG: cystathionine beta-lyase [Caulobacteraceae bacterium]|nr:cystathionine beta-lyase [Caulobacteraceae bacterium]
MTRPTPAPSSSGSRASPSRAAHVRVAAVLVGAPLLLASCLSAPAPPAERLVSAGERIARRECGECHALGEARVSPLADAPTFAALRPRYPRAEMAVVLTQRMAEVHRRMPRLRLEEDEVAEFLDYWAAPPSEAAPRADPPRSPRP